MTYNQECFQENYLAIKDRSYKYYSSPLLVKNNFKHGFFTKKSSEINLSLLSKHLYLNTYNCVLDQIHSNKIVLGSKTQKIRRVEADGMFSDQSNQNLWIYTADCMPILFADKKKRRVAAIHCGRRGLKNKIIKNLIKQFFKESCSKGDLLVAIGPSISKKNYLIDNKTIRDFYKQVDRKEEITYLEEKNFILSLRKFINFKNESSIPLNLKKHAHIQLLNENIPNTNIDISNICTFESNHEFFSWRRSRTYSRQWSFISP